MESVISARTETLKSLDKLPKMSAMTLNLLSRLARRDVDVNEVAALVERDTVLSAQILKLANSAIFSRKAPITHVHHAVAMIGVGMMRKFAVGMSVTNLFSRQRFAEEFSVTRFNLHSVATATMIELMTDDLPVYYVEGAFVAGLLHDVGKLLIAYGMRKTYGEIMAVHVVSDRPVIECERAILGTDHAKLSALAIQRWELPEPIRLAAFYHHEPEAAREFEGAGKREIGLAEVVNRADAFVNYLGMSVQPPRMMAGKPPSLAFEGFSFDETKLHERFQQEWQGMGDLFR